MKLKHFLSFQAFLFSKKIFYTNHLKYDDARC